MRTFSAIGRSSVFAIAMALLGFSGSSVTAQAPLNPSFEVGGLAGWTLIANGSGLGESTVAQAGGSPFFGGGTTKAALIMPIATVAAGGTGYTGTLKSSVFNMTAGTAVSFDWYVQSAADNPYFRAQLFDAGSGAVVNTYYKQTFAATTVWATASYTVLATGNYYLEFQGGSFDASFGTLIAANVYVDNINAPPPPPPGVVVTESGGSTNVTEGGATDTYTVVLNSVPTKNVTITLNPGTQLTVAPAVLTFTPANWNVPQKVTVTAVDDLVVEGPHTGTITHTAVSLDPIYNGIVIASVTANITDNDFPAQVIITESNGSTTVREAGYTDSYTVVLGKAPTANVTITATPGIAQLIVSPAVLTFTPANWAVPQTITVSALDDGISQGIHTSIITHAAVSADANYNGLAIASVVVIIRDAPGTGEGTFAGFAGPPSGGGEGDFEGSFGNGSGLLAATHAQLPNPNRRIPVLHGPSGSGADYQVFNVSQGCQEHTLQPAASAGIGPLGFTLLAGFGLGLIAFLAVKYRPA